MEVFAWNPKAGNETLEDFNERLASFCTENPVMGLDVSTFRGSILLSLTEAADAGVDSCAAVIPRVMLITAVHQLKLEQVVGEEVEKLAEADSEDSPSAPFKVTLHECPGHDHGFAVILVDGGEVELEAEGGPEAGQEPGQ